MTERLPIFPLRTVLFPGGLLPLHIFELRYRLMLSHRADHEPCFGVVLTRRGSEVGDQPQIHDVGTSAINVEHVKLPDGRSNLLVKGARRFRVLESDWEESYMVATVTWLDTDERPAVATSQMDAVNRIQSLLTRYLDAYNQATGQSATFRKLDHEPMAFAYAVASALPMTVESRQQLLEAEPPGDLLQALEATVRRETALLTRTGAYAFLPGQPGARFTSN